MGREYSETSIKPWNGLLERSKRWPSEPSALTGTWVITSRLPNIRTARCRLPNADRLQGNITLISVYIVAFVLWLSVGLCGVVASGAQVMESLPNAPTPQHPEQDAGREADASALPKAGRDNSTRASMADKIRDLPTRWLRGTAVPPERELYSLNNHQRFRVYVRQTYFSVGTYADRALRTGIDQARGVPSQWGGGMEGFGKRYASRYAQYVIKNTLTSAGDAALGYEPRYDLCRCRGFWNRTRHAMIRNFVTYNSTERELRPQLPLYGAAFVAGMAASNWKPGPRNPWSEGGRAAAEQAGWGVLSKWLNEFSGDIGRTISRRR